MTHLTRIAATALAAAWIAAYPLSAQDGQPGNSATGGAEAQTSQSGAGETPPLWLVSCSNRADLLTLSCETSQSIVLAAGSQRVATVSIAKDAGAPDVEGLFTVPLGVRLPAGVTVAVDGEALAQAAFQACDAQGCVARGAIGPAALESMRTGEELTTVVERVDGRSLTLTFQLSGLADSLALLP